MSTEEHKGCQMLAFHLLQPPGIGQKQGIRDQRAGLKLRCMIASKHLPHATPSSKHLPHAGSMHCTWLTEASA